MGNVMVEKVSDQQAYVDYVMKNLPDVKRGDVHIMQKGDSLWNLAQKALNKNDASNKEISDYMLLIAKLNNLNTVEKMNGLKVSDKIYMPEVSNTKAESPIKEKPNVSNLTPAEKSFFDIKETLLNDKTVFVEQAYPRFINLYHVYQDYTNPETGYHSRMHPVLTFQLDKTGNVKNFSYDDTKEDLNPIQYDYDVDAKGNIVIRSYTRKIKVGELDKNELKDINQILKNLTQNAKLTY